MRVGNTVKFLGSGESYYEKLIGQTGVVIEVGEYFWNGRNIPNAIVRFKGNRVINFDQDHLEVVK